MSIDVFEGRHQGLILAEMELENKAGADELVLPSFILTRTSRNQKGKAAQGVTQQG